MRTALGLCFRGAETNTVLHSQAPALMPIEVRRQERTFLKHGEHLWGRIASQLFPFTGNSDQEGFAHCVITMITTSFKSTTCARPAYYDEKGTMPPCQNVLQGPVFRTHKTHKSMKHALALIASCCVLCAQNKPDSDDPGELLRRAALGLDQPTRPPSTVDEKLKMANELKRMLREGKITQADIDRMLKERKIDAGVLLMMNVEDDAAPTSQPKPADKKPKPAAAEKPAEAKPKIPPINVRDELIELIHQLKGEANSKPFEYPITLSSDKLTPAAAMYDAQLKAKTEAQRLLLQALVELAKEAEKKEPTEVYHSSNPNDEFAGF